MLAEVEVSRVEQSSSLAEQPPRVGQHRRAADSLGRVFAMLLLPLSIAPVLLLGPSVLRAPVTLGHEAWGDVQRLEQYLQPARSSRPAIARPDPNALPTVSLGHVYGRWTAFPQVGKAQAGSRQLGPEDRTR